MINKKTRVDLITGFLGAGKTTFIVRYAKWLKDQGITFAVIENEFGAAGCDGALLRDIGMFVSELSGGCICCSLKIDFTLMLCELAGKVDRIIVEPSGIFSPADFFEVMGSPSVSKVCETGCVAAIVDPFAFESITGETADVFAAQLGSAGIILLCKSERLLPDELAEALIRIRESVSGTETDDLAPVIAKPWSGFDGDDFTAVSISGAKPLSGKRVTLNHANLFNSAAIEVKNSFSEKALNDALCEIMRDERYGSILRIKGTVPSSGGIMFWVNCTVSDICITETGEKNSILNIIGKGVSRKNIRDRLNLIKS